MHTTHPKVIGICTFLKTEFVPFFNTKTNRYKVPQINIRSLCQGKACLQKTQPHGHCHMAGMKPTDLNKAPSDQLNIPSAGKGFIRESTALGVGFYYISLKATDPQFLRISSIIWRELPQIPFLLRQKRVCCDKTCLLSRQEYVCCNKYLLDKLTFVTTKHIFCCDKSMLVVTKHSSWQT